MKRIGPSLGMLNAPRGLRCYLGVHDDEAGLGVAWYSPYLSEEDVDDDSPEEEKEVV
jgi:hypothetical protein